MATFYFIQATLLFIIGILLPTFQTTGAQVGVCYGMNDGFNGNHNLPSRQDVINLYRDNRIRKMRLYSPDPAALQALRRTNIEVILDVPNSALAALTNPDTARTWVQNNIQKYLPEVNFRYIAVGNEVDPKKLSGLEYFVLQAMQNVHNAIMAAELQNQIKVSTATFSGLIAEYSSPPSRGKFRDDARSFIQPIIQFLANNNLPLLANIYPYFSLPGNRLDYALFTAPGVVTRDPEGNREYSNLFDALVDVMYSAAEKAGGPNIEVVVSESGWPSDGGADASVGNAGTYYKNLIDHVKSGKGTPKRPGKNIETYLFAMFDENNKGPPETENHFGVFDPATKEQKYQLNFS